MVGDVDSTLHWCKDRVYSRVAVMHAMPFDTLCREFTDGSVLSSMMEGVMDVLFVASCFELPVVVLLGRLFWLLASELINIRVSSVDQLNLLLWNRVLPQTLLVLDPVPFYLDSMIESVDYVVTIQGTVGVSDGTYPPTRTVLMVPSSSVLGFCDSVRLSKLEVRHFEVDGVNQTEHVLGFSCTDGEDKVIFLQGVDVYDGGCSISGYGKVHTNHFSVTNTSVGVTVENVGQMFITATQNVLSEAGFKSGVFSCGLGFSFAGVSTFVGSGVCIRRCGVVFDVRVKRVFVLEDSCVLKCDSFGEILSSPVCIPSFHRNMVRLCACIFLLIFFFLFGTHAAGGPWYFPVHRGWGRGEQR